MTEFLRVDRVSKHYRVAGNAPLKALDEVSLTVEAGEWIAIMGPSGSGKTTLLNILGCLDQPTSGSVYIGATDVAKLSHSELVRFRAETVGLVFQQYHLIPHLTALENVMLAQYFHSMTDASEAQRTLQQVGLKDRASHLPSQLSGGEQQRVALARALVNDPKIILADEPTGNLDAANEQIVLDLLGDLHAQGRTILLVTHDERVGRCADRRVNLEHGRILETVVFTAEENEDFDEILEELWMQRESALHHEGTHFTEVQRRRLFSTMSRIGLLQVAGDSVAFTGAGEERARSVIRRHRLAERLFMDVLSIRDDASVELNACTFEHILSPEVTDRICGFLGHPTTCPHGSPIPPGPCCNGARGALPVESSGRKTS
jgi:putative ABC transport system ATP-binding protein